MIFFTHIREKKKLEKSKKASKKKQKKERDKASGMQKFTLGALGVYEVSEIHPLGHPRGRDEDHRNHKLPLAACGTIPERICSTNKH